VAAACGFSVATVSRTLQFPDRVTDETKEQVQAAIRKLGYIPNAQARNLRTARTGLILALVPDISNLFFSNIIRGIESVAKQHNYSVLLGDTQYLQENEQRYADMISAREADGMITLSPRIPRIHRTDGVPIVNICETVTNSEISTIRIDNAAASRDVTRYLLALAHRRIAFIGGIPDTPISVERRDGFLDALREAGIPEDPRLQVQGDFTLESGVRGAEWILARQPWPTAFVCASDELAIGVLHVLRGRNLQVPKDISVVGFDDISFARYVAPPLTTVAQPRAEFGREAMLMLLDLLRDPQTPVRHMILPTQLIIRGSTGPAPRG
jgi:LacI family repressor for deo operon, udp, cdd, tsx, nupC, and nupG